MRQENQDVNMRVASPKNLYYSSDYDELLVSCKRFQTVYSDGNSEDRQLVTSGALVVNIYIAP